MKVRLDELKKKLTELLATSGGDEKDVERMADMRLQYDFHHNTFSGIEEIEKILVELKESKGTKITFDVDKPSVKLIDAHGRSGELVGMEAVDLLVTMAKETGVAVIGIHNATYHGILETYSRAIAAHDLVALVSANGGPQGVVPYGGRKDIFGTNPISYGIPTAGMPIVFDAATAKYAYGTIRLAKKHGETLPEGAYLDQEGNWTTDPLQAVSIVPFGEHKGSAINLLLEVLTGALVRGKSGLLLKEEADLGAIFIAIDPAAFGSLQEFKKQTTQLVNDVQAVQPADGFTEVRVPGYKGEEHKQRVLQEGVVEIDDVIWAEFEKLYKSKVQ